jgi:hypothetical protein
MELEKKRKVVGPTIDQRPEHKAKKLTTLKPWPPSREIFIQGTAEGEGIDDYMPKEASLESLGTEDEPFNPRKTKDRDAEAAHLRDNKARLFDILTHAILAGEHYSTTVTWRFDPEMEFRGRTGDLKLPGLAIVIHIRHPHAKGPLEFYVRVDSPDWEFDELEAELNKLKQEHEEEKIKEEARNIILSRLTAVERELLGFANWKNTTKESK